MNFRFTLKSTIASSLGMRFPKVTHLNIIGRHVTIKLSNLTTLLKVVHMLHLFLMKNNLYLKALTLISEIHEIIIIT